MARYWRVYKTFFLTSLSRELEYRINFLAKILQNITWVVFFVLVLLVIFRNTKMIAGWNRDEAFVLSATLFLMSSFSIAFFHSLVEIPQHVRTGTLDFVISRPIDSQFWISTRKFNFNELGSMLASIGLLIVAVPSLAQAPTAMQWLGYFIGVLCSITVFYSFNLALMTLGIWLVKVDNLWVLGETVTGVARYPLEMYNSGVQKFLTFVFPLAVLSFIPASQLVRGFDPGTLGLGVLWAVVALIAARKFWFFALRSYGSASS